jgi:hypothetical protein
MEKALEGHAGKPKRRIFQPFLGADSLVAGNKSWWPARSNATSTRQSTKPHAPRHSGTTGWLRVGTLSDASEKRPDLDRDNHPALVAGMLSGRLQI